MATRDPQLRERRPRPSYHPQLPVGLRQAASAGQPASRASTRERVPVASTPSSTSAGQHGYLLDNQAEQAGQRFAALAALYDPITIGHLDALGSAQGGAASRWAPAAARSCGWLLVEDFDSELVPDRHADAHGDGQATPRNS